MILPEFHYARDAVGLRVSTVLAVETWLTGCLSHAGIV